MKTIVSTVAVVLLVVFGLGSVPAEVDVSAGYLAYQNGRCGRVGGRRYQQCRASPELAVHGNGVASGSAVLRAHEHVPQRGRGWYGRTARTSRMRSPSCSSCSWEGNAPVEACPSV